MILDDVPLVDTDSHANRVFVVSSYAEGFGQVIRKFEAIAGTVALAQARADFLEAREHGDFPYQCEVDEVPVGVLSDERDGYGAQPTDSADT
ncbi:MAG: hypothetical protein R3B13_16590 [Polyangiaceae bacterium]